MRKIKEIIRLSEKCSLSRKGIARSCGISINTVKDYLERYGKSDITFDAIRDMNDQDVYWLLFPEKKEQKSEHERDKIDFAYLSI